MARYIDADKADVNEVSIYCNPDDVQEWLDAQPTADVVEVKQAEWKWGKGVGGQYGIWCTNCGSGWTDSPNAEWIAKSHDYCGKCGAKMDGGRKE